MASKKYVQPEFFQLAYSGKKLFQPYRCLMPRSRKNHAELSLAEAVILL